MSEKARIMYVEDDETLSFITKDNLEEKGYEITCVCDGLDAMKVFKNNVFDLCILDVMLPNIDGFTIAKQIREINSDIPIIFLTAKSMKEDKLFGLRTGGDDYITKPFSIEELVLKVDIFLRRSKVYISEPVQNESITPVFQIGIYTFNPSDLSLRLEENEERLTQKEADLLTFFCKNANRIISREEILETLWGENDYFLGRSLDVFISRLRKYLKKDESIRIENIHGVGFKFIAEVK